MSGMGKQEAAALVQWCHSPHGHGERPAGSHVMVGLCSA